VTWPPLVRARRVLRAPTHARCTPRARAQLLGTEGGQVQALGCMDAFCRECIATHLHAQHSRGVELSCPICKRAVPGDEVAECGPPKRTPPPAATKPAASSAAADGGVRSEASATPATVLRTASEALRGDAAAPDELSGTTAQHEQQVASQSGARRPSMRRRLTSAAVTAAAVVAHAPQVLRTSPEHLAAAAHAMSHARRDAAAAEADADGDAVFLDDGTVVRFEDHLDHM
jgi:hypothetical protein